MQKYECSPLEKTLRRTLYRKSFYDFAKEFWNEADPQPLVDGHIVQFFCETFQYMCRGWVGYDEIDIDLPEQTDDVTIIDVRQNKRNLCINIPPRHSKSMIFNVLAGVWIWTNAPIKLASVSHTGGLAGVMNSKRKAILNSDKFKYFFPDIQLMTNSKGALTDNRGAELYSINRDAMTGYGADIIVNDDLTNAEAARKDKEEMQNAINYYRNTMPSRINNVEKYVIMNIQQRLAPNDVTGNIMSDPALASQYTFIVIPAIFKKTTYLVCPISGTIFKYNAGDPLWPERFGNYESLKAQVGQTVWETQYEQNAIASDKIIIEDSMINLKSVTEVPDMRLRDLMYASHDFPVKDKDSSDFLGSTLAYRTGSTLYITDSLEKKMAFVSSVNYVKAIESMYPDCIQIIEDKANGSAILQQLQDEVAGMQAYQPGTASKMQRLESASLYMNNVVFVKTVWNEMTQSYILSEPLKNLLHRLKSFPYVDHDDVVDSFSMLILFVFMDRRYMVYGRAFNDDNIVYARELSEIKDAYAYDTIFFNKEGDIWKALRIGIHYDTVTSIFVKDEVRFKGSMEDGLTELKKFAPDHNVFIDCSATDALEGISKRSTFIERYTIDDFDKSVSQLNLAFSSKIVKVSHTCPGTKVDIESFKFSKTKDETVKYASTKDGYVACIRMAMKYYGISL